MKTTGDIVPRDVACRFQRGGEHSMVRAALETLIGRAGEFLRRDQ